MPAPSPHRDRTDGAAMIKIVKDEQSIFNDLVRYMSLDIGHKADTAGVVLGIRTIQAFLRQPPAARLAN